MSEINYKLGLYGTEHSKCNRMITLGVKGLMNVVALSWTLQQFLKSGG